MAVASSQDSSAWKPGGSSLSFRGALPTAACAPQEARELRTDPPASPCSAEGPEGHLLLRLTACAGQGDGTSLAASGPSFCSQAPSKPLHGRGLSFSIVTERLD